MSSSGITEYFRRVQAPLCNSRWSWGSVREADQAIFLRVWADEYVKLGEQRFYRLTAYKIFRSKPGDLGWKERQRHVQMLRDRHQRAPVYMVICTAKDTKAIPREIADYDRNSLFVGGKPVEYQGDWWLEATARIAPFDAHSSGRFQ